MIAPRTRRIFGSPPFDPIEDLQASREDAKARRKTRRRYFVSNQRLFPNQIRSHDANGHVGGGRRLEGDWVPKQVMQGCLGNACFAASREPSSKVQEDPGTSSGRIRRPFGYPSCVEGILCIPLGASWAGHRRTCSMPADLGGSIPVATFDRGSCLIGSMDRLSCWTDFLQGRNRKSD